MTTQVILSKIYEFTAAHRLHSETLDSAQNIEVYDKCNNYNGHGHDYRLEVSITGSLDDKTGMIIPIKDFDLHVQSVLAILDYKHLNQQVEFFKHRLSSGEIIVQFLWQELEKEFPDNMLFHLKLWETNNNYFELGKN